jgi:hypothetical protein
LKDVKTSKGGIKTGKKTKTDDNKSHFSLRGHEDDTDFKDVVNRYYEELELMEQMMQIRREENKRKILG